MLKKSLSITLLCASFYAAAMDNQNLRNLTHADLIKKISNRQNDVSPESLDYACELARRKREIDYAKEFVQEEESVLIASLEIYTAGHPDFEKDWQLITNE